MEISAHWATRKLFTGLEAACLIAGIEPRADAVQSLAVSTVYMKLEAAYIEACGWFREHLEHEESPPNLSDEWVDDMYPLLFSHQLEQHYDQVASAQKYSDYKQCNEYAMSWLDTNLEAFHVQRFRAHSISGWLREASMTSAFNFDGNDPVATDPADRRIQVKLMVERCQGNKTLAAKMLGVSRQRVSQLLEDTSSEKRKALRKTAASPFNNPWGSRGK